jgi:hypothetical protein
MNVPSDDKIRFFGGHFLAERQAMTGIVEKSGIMTRRCRERFATGRYRMTIAVSSTVPHAPARERLDDKPLYEIIDGQRVDLPLLGILASLPELMVEVVGPHDLAEEIMEHVAGYWAAGTQLVWVAYPTQRLVYVYELPRQVRILGVNDELDGGAVLPGMRIPIASLFPA